MAKGTKRHYKSTESKYKGGAREMYITYDLKQKTRGDGSALYPKVKRVYIAGDVKDWETGNMKKRSGQTVHGVAIQYKQTRAGYHRKGYTVKRDGDTYKVKPATVGGSSQEFRKVVEIPEHAQNVQLSPSPRNSPGSIKAHCRMYANKKDDSRSAIVFLLSTGTAKTRCAFPTTACPRISFLALPTCKSSALHP